MTIEIERSTTMTGGRYNDRAFAALIPSVTARGHYEFPWDIRPADEYASAMVMSANGAIVSVRENEDECRLFIELATSPNPTDVPDDFVRALLDCAFAGSDPEPGETRPRDLPWWSRQEGDTVHLCTSPLGIVASLPQDDATQLLHQAKALWLERAPGIQSP